MNICRAINRCFLGAIRFGSKIVGSDDSIINESSLMKVLDKICSVLAVVKTTWIVLFFFIVQIPFDYEKNGFSPSTIVRVFCGLWVTYSISYHYWKTRTAKPVRMPTKTSTGPNCSFCSSSKPILTSHCRTCNTCIYKKDHHCPWMGQCIGVHNQSTFFLFLFNVFLSTILVLYVEYEFWLDNLRMWMTENTWNSLYQGHGMISAFTISIVISLHLIMISFVVTYAFLVSGGFSLIDMLFQRDTKKKLSLSMIHLRWKQYLTVRRDDSIIKALFIPSDRTVKDFDFI